MQVLSKYDVAERFKGSIPCRFPDGAPPSIDYIV